MLNKSLHGNAHAQLAAMAAGATRPSKAMVLHRARPFVMYHSAGAIMQLFESIKLVYENVFPIDFLRI